MLRTQISATAFDGSSSRIATGSQLGAGREQRQYKRYRIVLAGRFMRQNKEEHPCRLKDISCGGAAIVTPVPVEVGERIVAYFEQIGGLEGNVVRTFDGGFAIEFTITQHKREKLATQLEALSGRHGASAAHQRRHPRFATNNTTTLRLDDDISIPVRVIDVSVSGASVETDARPMIGSEVVLGKLRAKVVRHHAEGLGLQFINMQNPDALRRTFR
ncbi:MAG: PilZ domain-containing protein [Hyphomicrobiaceae bacterium]|jgi:hypothetical protein